jgi:hypothetical protein
LVLSIDLSILRLMFTTINILIQDILKFESIHWLHSLGYHPVLAGWYLPHTGCTGCALPTQYLCDLIM